MDNISIKNNIRNKRKERKFTQEEIAHRLGISLTAYRDFEKGGTSIVNGNVMKLADLLDTTTEELVLGYKPAKENINVIEDVKNEYGGQITNLQKRVEDLEKLVKSLEEICFICCHISNTRHINRNYTYGTCALTGTEEATGLLS